MQFSIQKLLNIQIVSLNYSHERSYIDVTLHSFGIIFYLRSSSSFSLINEILVNVLQ